MSGRSLVSAVARVLASLHPPDFRRRFGRAMADDYAALAEARGTGAALVRAGRDALVSLPAAWGRSARSALAASPFAPGVVVRETRFAARALRRDPAFTGTAVGVLGLAFAAATTVAAVVNAYMVRPLPYPASERLVDVSPALPVDLAEAREVMEIPLTWELDAFTLVGGERPEQVRGAWVLPGHFEAFGITPALGRAFHADEWGEGAQAVAVISWGLWQRRFGGDPDVLGESLRTYSSDRPEDTEVFTIVGVLPRDLWFHHAFTEILVPIRQPNALYQGRLRPDVSIERAEAALTELGRGRTPELDDGGRVELTPLADAYVQHVRPTLLLLTVAVVLVCAIACGNVALLCLVRVRRRAGELGVLRALGAGRGAVVAQLASEGAVVAMLAGGVGVLVGAGALRVLGSVVPARLGLPVPGGPAGLRLDPVVLAWLVAGTGLCALLLGLLALLGLGGRGRANGAGAGRLGAWGRDRGRRRLQDAVMGVELALSLALLVAAGLAVRSARHVAAVDPGLEPAGVVMAAVTLRERSYPDPEARLAFHDGLGNALAAIPGVESWGFGVRTPLGSRYAGRPVEAEGRPAASASEALRATPQVAGPGYFPTLGIPVLRGRSFEPEDGPGTTPVGLVSEDLARTLWPGQDPLGRRFREVSEGEPVWRTVVGVVADVRQDPMAHEAGDYYLPISQEAPRFMTAFLRVRGDRTAAVRGLEEAVAALDPEVAVPPAQDLASVAREIAEPGRFLAVLLSLFGAFAILLALVGLYGTVAYAATQRRFEVAVRIALGAERDQVTGLLVRERLASIAVGVAGGLAGAWFISRLLASQLAGVSPTDPSTYAAATALLAAAALLSAWIPARRAARAEPMRVLRED